MRRLISIALLALAITPAAAALEGDELLALVAMPLAVAAVADANDVPTDDMVEVVTVLNDAAVPPPQFVEIVRYSPAAIVVEERPDPFVVYLRDQYDSGLRGDRFVTVVQNRLRTYDLGPVDLNVVEPVEVTYRDVDAYYEPYYEPATFMPQVVQTRVTQRYVVPYQTVYDTDDLVALAAMPLAVAVASQLTGVPTNDLFQMVSLLNQASVPPAQFIEVVRYAPAALVMTDGREPFVVYLQDRYDAGLRGPQYVTVIESRLRDYDLGPFDLEAPRIYDYDPDVYYQPEVFIPPVVRTRVVESSHPHGGPPGQLKKELGLQTGAEVVHGTRSARVDRRYGDTARVDRRVFDNDREVRSESRGKSRKQTLTERSTSRGKANKQTLRGNSSSRGKGKAKRQEVRVETAPRQRQVVVQNETRGRGQQMKAQRQPSKSEVRGSQGGGSDKKAGGGGQGKGQAKGKGKGKGR